MRATSTFIAGFLNSSQSSELQGVFDEVCAEFDFGSDDKEARDRIADTLMAIATTAVTRDRALRAARQTGREIIKDRRGTRART